MKIKNLVVLGGLLLCSSVAISSDWVEVYSDDRAVIAVDKQSMSYNKYLREVKVWDRFTLSNGTIAVSSKIINCKSYSSKLLRRDYTFPKLDDTTIIEEFPTWERATPDSVGYDIIDMICKVYEE